jgi:hypothetical protein
MSTAHKLATWDALASRPTKDRSEIIEGVLVTPPSPLPRHARIQAGIAREIGGPFDADDGNKGKPGGWWILADIDVRLSRHDIVCPTLLAGIAAGFRTRGTFFLSVSLPIGFARSSPPPTRRMIA